MLVIFTILSVVQAVLATAAIKESKHQESLYLTVLILAAVYLVVLAFAQSPEIYRYILQATIFVGAGVRLYQISK